MNWLTVAMTGVLALAGIGLWSVTPATAQNAPATETPASHDSGPRNRIRPRPPVRIRVHPLNQFLGTDAVRQCESWLAAEYRPSGTVIVPRMRCWWERG
jgi:hypothetical protein